MSEITRIYATDAAGIKKIESLLQREGIRLDKNLDYMCGIYNAEMQLIATGSAYKNTLRCLAVSAEHQGEGLLNELVTHLIEQQHARGNADFFLYTKEAAARFFRDLGFYEVVRVPGELVFMESNPHGFQKYLQGLMAQTASFLSSAKLEAGKVAAIVMNANPFTLGHQYLVQQAAKENTLVHLFLLSEEGSLVPFALRKRFVLEGICGLENVLVHEGGSYIVSSATFPSYFQKDDLAVSRGHALLDAQIFIKIAKALQIVCRYVGEEPFSIVTNLYNRVLAENLPNRGIQLRKLRRLTSGGQLISASTVRQMIHNNQLDRLRDFLPAQQAAYWQSQEAAVLRKKLQQAEQVVHY